MYVHTLKVSILMHMRGFYHNCSSNLGHGWSSQHYDIHINQPYLACFLVSAHTRVFNL